MPAYKVPCPRCANFIMRDVAVCPFCQARDPFAPMRCASCNAVIEDPRWAACQRCGTPVPKPSNATAAAHPVQPPAAAPAAAAPATRPGRLCTGCGAPLAAGARFCTVCGTLPV